MHDTDYPVRPAEVQRLARLDFANRCAWQLGAIEFAMDRRFWSDCQSLQLVRRALDEFEAAGQLATERAA